MRLTLAILVSSLLSITNAIPLPASDSTTDSDTAIAQIEDPYIPPGTVLIEPPPLFDPSEPRPEPLFGVSSSNKPPGSELRRALIQESRAETLLPFDGAHVHPYKTPYTPERLPGTCVYIFNCKAARTSLEIAGSLALLSLFIYTLIYISNKLFRRILRSARTRTRSPSGSLRLEPELGTKTSASQQASAPDATTPLLQTWSEKSVPMGVI